MLDSLVYKCIIFPTGAQHGTPKEAKSGANKPEQQLQGSEVSGVNAIWNGVRLKSGRGAPSRAVWAAAYEVANLRR